MLGPDSCSLHALVIFRMWKYGQYKMVFCNVATELLGRNLNLAVASCYKSNSACFITGRAELSTLQLDLSVKKITLL